MTAWRIETSTDFDRSIRKLDKVVARRVIDYLVDLLELEDPRQRGRGLSGGSAGFWRYRIGDYRVIADIQDDRLVVIAIAVAHRSKVYGR